jgi:hypothetical protein
LALEVERNKNKTVRKQFFFGGIEV